MRRRSILIIATLALVTVAIIAALYPRAPRASSPQAGAKTAAGGGSRGGQVATAVSAVAVRRGSLDAVAKLSGEVRAARSMKVFPDTGGRIMEGLAPIGTRVAVGEVVAQIDPSRPGTRFEPSPVRAPTAGTVTAHFVDPGYIATTTTAIAEIASLDELDVVVSVPERYAPDISVGSRATVRIGALGGRDFEAAVRSADPVLDPATRSKRVFFRLPPGLRGVQSGMFAEVTITLSRTASALLVPVDALVRRGGEDVVYVVADGVATERKVIVGRFAASDAEIISGLEEGEIVIVRGQNLIRDGSRVTVMDRG